MNYSFGWSAAILGVSFTLVQVQAVQAISKAEISKVAQSITVMIQDDQNPLSFGSGVIIKREGQTYTVLTAQHVVKSPGNFKVMTPDDKKHPMIQSSIQRFPNNVDLALIQFTSAEIYSIAKIGDSAQSPSGTASFVAGFPGKTEVRSEPSYYFTSGEIAANANKPLKDGYAIAYNNPTLPGMSGGPVLNEKAELIGIHGRAENAAVPQNAKIREDIYVLKTEFNYAVPINTFLRLAPQVNKPSAFGMSNRPVTSEPTADDYVLQGSIKYKSRDYKGAIADYDKAIRISSNNAAAYSNRGDARSELGDEKGAIIDYEQAIRINPNNAYAYLNRGVARYKIGDKKGAITDYEQAIRINPNDAYAHNNRGVAYSDLGDEKGAIIDYEQAIRINPNYASAYNNRGTSRYALGDEKGAIADLEKAIHLDPNYANAYANRGLFRLGLGDKQVVIADWKKAAALFKSQGNKMSYERMLQLLRHRSASP
jgi:tetratricopeptide (TPR) repeat protein